jgi:hypothetical protein
VPIQLIEPTDSIDVSFVPVLIFGPPGCGKTSLTQTADAPFTLDFDTGIHRSFNRKDAVRFDSWEEANQLLVDAAGSPRHDTKTPAAIVAKFRASKTLVVDTLGRALDKMVPLVIALNAKNRGPSGLSPQGWGVLGGMFAQWIKQVRELGKDLVMVCHEEQGSDAAGNPTVKPDMPGKMSWKEIHKWTDQIGQIRYEGKARFLDFNPTETASCCKNAAQFEAMELPRLESAPRLLADLIVEAKARIGKTAEASAAVARVVDEWQAKLKDDPSLAEFNGYLSSPELKSLKDGVKAQVWHVLQAHAQAAGWKLDKATKQFTAPATTPEPEAAA